jgi:hypothetical protein
MIATASFRRIVAIELEMCRSVLSGSKPNGIVIADNLSSHTGRAVR